jgi:hypothetical protein
MNAHHTRHRRRHIVAVVVAGSIVGVSGAMAVAAEQRPSLDARIQAERAAIARWAEENGLSGLSPASLSHSGTAGADQARIAAERQQIAEWARSQGLSGLSPASLQAADD